MSCLLHAATVDASCPDAIQWTGEERLTHAIRERLAEGALGSRPDADCQGLAVVVLEHEGRIVFVLERGSERTTHAVRAVASATPWLESWILPTLPPPGSPSVAAEVSEPGEPMSVDGPESSDVEPTAGEATEAEAEAEAVVEPTPAPDRETSPTLVRTSGPFHLALTGALDFDRVGQLWYGGGLTLRAWLGAHGWLGAVAEAVVSVEVDRTERRQLRVSVSGGWARVFPEERELWLGLGFGVVSAKSKLEYPDESVVFDTESGPYVLAIVGYERMLGGRWLMLVSGTVRIHINDGFARGPEVGEDAAPIIGAGAFTLRVGFGWHLGETP